MGNSQTKTNYKLIGEYLSTLNDQTKVNKTHDKMKFTIPIENEGFSYIKWIYTNINETKLFALSENNFPLFKVHEIESDRVKAWFVQVHSISEIQKFLLYLQKTCNTAYKVDKLMVCSKNNDFITEVKKKTGTNKYTVFHIDDTLTNNIWQLRNTEKNYRDGKYGHFLNTLFNLCRSECIKSSIDGDIICLEFYTSKVFLINKKKGILVCIEDKESERLLFTLERVMCVYNSNNNLLGETKDKKVLCLPVESHESILGKDFNFGYFDEYLTIEFTGMFLDTYYLNKDYILTGIKLNF